MVVNFHKSKEHMIKHKFMEHFIKNKFKEHIMVAFKLKVY
jgi:hypothetical protein